MKYLLLALLPIFFAQSQNNHLLELTSSASVKPESFSGVSAFPSVEKKSTALGILYSFLLPGMGELYAGDYTTGKYFTISEGVFWGTYFGMSAYSTHMKSNYTTYARTNGGVSTEVKDDDYFATIGNYKDIYQYNDEKAFERNFEEMYDVGTHFWKWNTVSERKSYRNMWVTSQEVKNNMRFVVGAALLNRIASAINAVRLVVKHNRSLKESEGVVYYFDYSPVTNSLNLNLHTRF